MPADPLSVLLLIILNSAETVARLWPYVVGGVAAAVLLSHFARQVRWTRPAWLPRSAATPLAAILGVAFPLSTTGAVPLVLRLRDEGLPAESALAFVLASSLMNPQLFLLTMGAMGMPFALAQLGVVLLLSTLLGMAFGSRPAVCSCGLERSEKKEQAASSWSQSVQLVGHVGLYFLVGAIIGASFQVLLPWLGALDWLSEHGWMSTPVLGWLAAPFYTCGGSAVPLARSLQHTGFSSGTLFAFLLVGPALRGTTLANLSCLLRKELLLICLAALALAGGLTGYGFDNLIRSTF